MDITVGTAGHIDHGKTTLIKALTGVDTDRLPEEKKRGITIDIGFAELDLGDVHIGFVDVPGHERFVKNMLAGASGIDLVILVVAADEGVMPQTREHFEICRLLNVRSGLVVLTKSDAVDDETAELARLEIAELVEGSFLQDAPVIAVSARSGNGIEELRMVLHDLAIRVTSRKDEYVTRLPIDRIFTVKGFGAVVTGTLVSGEIKEGDELELLPSGQTVRVRGLQSHSKKTSSSHAGMRVAVNIAGVDHAEISRGMVLCEKNTLRPTQILDTEIEVLKTAKSGLRSRQRVRVHIGTVEALARVVILNDEGIIAPGTTEFAQLRLEAPVVAVPGERFIIRSYSPQVTIAGGSVIDTAAQKHRGRDLQSVRTLLQKLSDAAVDPREKARILIDSAAEHGTTVEELQARTGLRRKLLTDAAAYAINNGSVIEAGDHLVSSVAFNDMATAVTAAVEGFHKRKPLARGIGLEELRNSACRHASSSVFRAVIAELQGSNVIVVDNDMIRMAGHRAELSPEETLASDLIRKAYTSPAFDVPRLEEMLSRIAAESKLSQQKVRTVFQMFLDSGELVKVTDEFYFSKISIDKLAAMLVSFADKSTDRLIDVPGFKEVAGVSRKYAIPLLEYFDREKLTVRSGDKRLIL